MNTASRMESHGVPGTVQVTERAWAGACWPTGSCSSERGTIEVKGKGPMRTYFLLGRSPGPSPM